MSGSKIKQLVVYIAACIAFLTGIGLCIAGFCVPPTGVINGSVLTATGEFLTFFGSVFGIGEYTRIQIAKIQKGKDEDEVEE